MTDSDEPTLPSPESPLEGGCLCGGVRYRITAPLVSAGYCHCTHCQRRTGTGSSANGRVPRAGFELLVGEELMRYFKPASGVAKYFCTNCGSALSSGNPFTDEEVVIRLGTLDGDPGTRPTHHQFVSSAASWEPVPEDGLKRYPHSRLG